MVKRILAAMVIVLLVSCLAGSANAQEENIKLIKGVVQEVAADGSYLILNDQKMLIDEEIAEYMNMEAGDEVEVSVEETGQGITIMDFNYI